MNHKLITPILHVAIVISSMSRRPKLKLVNACTGDALDFGHYSRVIYDYSDLEWYARVVQHATGVPRAFVKFIVPCYVMARIQKTSSFLVTFQASAQI